MVLIIAEKPSLARNIAAGIEYAVAQTGQSENRCPNAQDTR